MLAIDCDTNCFICGTSFQDGFIFNPTLFKNYDKLNNIKEFCICEECFNTTFEICESDSWDSLGMVTFFWHDIRTLLNNNARFIQWPAIMKLFDRNLYVGEKFESWYKSTNFYNMFSEQIKIQLTQSENLQFDKNGRNCDVCRKDIDPSQDKIRIQLSIYLDICDDCWTQHFVDKIDGDKLLYIFSLFISEISWLFDQREEPCLAPLYAFFLSQFLIHNSDINGHNIKG